MSNRSMIIGIMIAVAVWGGMLALGALLFGMDQETGNITYSVNIWRGLIVFTCVFAFLGMWIVALATQQRKPKSTEDHLEDK